MSSGDSFKVKKNLALSEMSAFFRELADAFEGNSNTALSSEENKIQDFQKIEIKMKRQMTAVSIKMKVTPEFAQEQDQETQAPVDQATDKQKPKYKKLKKQMDETCKTIQQSFSEKRLPDQEIVHTFLRDALIMVSFSGYGDEHYEPFVAACRRFSDACLRSDWNAAEAGFQQIDQLKKNCHDRYK